MSDNKRAPAVPDRSKPVPAMSARLLSVEFKRDHVGAGGAKLIHGTVPETIKIGATEVTSNFGDNTVTLEKPEWDVARGGAKASHPVSYTKGTVVMVQVRLLFTIPVFQVAGLERITGRSTHHGMEFEIAADGGNTLGMVQDGQIAAFTLEASKPLVGCVHIIREATIDWEVVLNGTTVKVGQSGPHNVYVTFAQPGGAMSVRPKSGGDGTEFVEIGAQAITEERLRWACDFDSEILGRKDELECALGVFKHLGRKGVTYTVGRRYSLTSNTTGCQPQPSLHHYLWLCNDAKADGECHNLAAAFTLACRILGVTGPFQQALMYPQPSRNEDSSFSKNGSMIKGRLDKPFIRTTSRGVPAQHPLVFLDGKGVANHFEGVVKYRGMLFAIGDAIFDVFGKPKGGESADDLNSTCYFTDRKEQSTQAPLHSLQTHAGEVAARGGFRLQFFDEGNRPAKFQYPYPTVKPGTVMAPEGKVEVPGTFKWED